MATDISKSSAEQLFDLIAEANTATIGELAISDVSFGAPAEHVGEEPGEVDVVVSAVPNSGYSGNVTVNYDRLDMAGFGDLGPALEVHVGLDATVGDIVAAFNAQFGANLSLADDVDGSLTPPTPDDDGEPFVLVANATSLAYTGSVEITVYLDSVDLADLITVTTLSGLEFPEA